MPTAGDPTSQQTPPRPRRAGRLVGRLVGRRAFTLLELLIAMTISAIIIASLYSAMRIGFKAEAAAEAAVEPARTGELAMGLLRPDFESAASPAGTLATSFTGVDGSGDGGMPADSLVFYTVGDPLDEAALFQAASGGGGMGGTGMGGTGMGGTGGKFGSTLGGTFSSRTTTAGSVPGAGEVRMVELGLVPSPVSGNVLVRRVTTNVLATTPPVPYEEVVCRGVTSFNLRYFDGTTWQDSWDSTQLDNNAPTAVEVSMTLRRGEGDEAKIIPFTRVFLISTSGLWNAALGATTGTGTGTGTAGGAGQ